jgi:hypothetical protein
MAQITEAACLLDTGMLYGARVLLKPPAGHPVFAGFKAGAFSLYYGDAPVFHFDLEGRWQKAFLDGRHYLKGLDATVQTVERSREDSGLTLTRRRLGFAESSDLDALVRSTVLDLIADLDVGRFERVAPPPLKARPLSAEVLRAFLETAARWDAAAWFRQRERFLDAYGPLPLLPPDCTAPLVLQMTFGDESGRTIGGGPAAEFYARTPPEFESHVRTVAALYGRRVSQCRQVVLAGADALRRPVDDLAACLEIVGRFFPIDPGHGPRRPETGEDASSRLDGVHAVVDRLEGPLPRRDDWPRLHALGLTRVNLAIESGDPAVRAAYGKSWTNDAARSLASDVKAAGIGLGVLLLIGAGGRESDTDAHAETTAAFLDSLDLGAGDLVSLLNASQLAAPNVGPPLTEAAMQARTGDLLARLVPLRKERKVRIAACSTDKQSVL